MEIVFHGEHGHADIAVVIEDVLNLLNARWSVESFKDLHLSLTLVDHLGFEIDLIDSNTGHDLRVMNVYPHDHCYVQKRKLPNLKLV